MSNKISIRDYYSISQSDIYHVIDSDVECIYILHLLNARIYIARLANSFAVEETYFTLIMPTWNKCHRKILLMAWKEIQ